MHPLVRNGDILLIEPYNHGGVRVGDIVLCTTETGQVLVHRVLRNRADGNGKRFLIQGDQSPKPDGWIPQKQIHGRLVEIERDGRLMKVIRCRVRFLGLLIVLVQTLGMRQSLTTRIVSILLKRSTGFAEYIK